MVGFTFDTFMQFEVPDPLIDHVQVDEQTDEQALLEYKYVHTVVKRVPYYILLFYKFEITLFIKYQEAGGSERSRRSSGHRPFSERCFCRRCASEGRCWKS